MTERGEGPAVGRGKLLLLCILACIIAGGGAGLAGVDPVSSGLIGFGAAGLAFAFLARKARNK